ncbi:MAG: hypothetical protein ABIN67_03030 [Ferruginibacter sp.]
MKRALISFIVIAIFTCCNTPSHLHNTGVYTIKKRIGSTTEFYEVKGQYQVFSDTLKVNDKIIINVIRARQVKGNKSMIAHN